MTIRFHIRVTGQVQGVFFRRSAKIEAEKLGIVGWVRNDEDSSVEVMAQGEKKNVDKFIAWCKKGPPFARVKDVEVEEQKGLENFDGFEILD